MSDSRLWLRLGLCGRVFGDSFGLWWEFGRCDGNGEDWVGLWDRVLRVRIDILRNRRHLDGFVVALAT